MVNKFNIPGKFNEYGIVDVVHVTGFLKIILLDTCKIAEKFD